MTKSLDDGLANTEGGPEEIDLDEEVIDLDDVVPEQNQLNSAAGEEVGNLIGTGDYWTRRNPFANPEIGQSSLFINDNNFTWQGEAPWFHASSVANSESGYPSSPSVGLSSTKATKEPISLSQSTTSNPSAGASKIKVAPSVQTDSGYGSVTHESVTHEIPKTPRKPQTKKVIREPPDIVVERRFIKIPLARDSENVTKTQTLYTGDQSIMGARRTRRYISEFVNNLYTQLQNQLTDDNMKTMMELLPDLLEAFALKLGQTSQAQIKRDAMYFIHTHKSQIAQTMKTLFNKNRSIHGSDADFGAEFYETSILRPEELLSGSHVVVTDDEISSEDIAMYLEAVTKDLAFKWLIGKLQILLASAETNSDAMKNISTSILSYLPPIHVISRQHPSKPFRVTFDVECDILGFIKDQEYHEPAAEVIPKVVTLTGSLDDVQATTCEQYFLQTWPTAGCNLLQAIQGALRQQKSPEPFRDPCQYKFEDRTMIKVTIGERSMKVEAIGTPHSIAEIGEQIGWFATAFYSSSIYQQVSFCHPEVLSFRPQDNIDLQFEDAEKNFMCRILVATDHIRDSLSLLNGQCWQQMFNNPVVVIGYPIKPRGNLESGIGMELPFEMMMTLADARYLTTFDEKTVVKGFSTVLLPMRQQDNLIIWHLIDDKSGARISYRDPRIQLGMLIPSSNFTSARHIIGWCTNAQNNIGSPDANYDIEYSGLSQGKGSLTWEGVELSVGAGNYFKVGTTFARGKKDRPVCNFVSDGYVSIVEHIGKHHFMLYDVEEKRAWLSDGLPVLLHLVRASLRRDKKEYPTHLFTEQIEKLNEAPPSTQGVMAAKAVLFDDENRLISLRLKDTRITEQLIERTIKGETVEELVRIKEKTYIRLENKVEEICHYLEKTIDVTAKAINEGVLKGAPKSILGGFDFMSVATHENLRFVTTKISTSGHGSGWTDLLDSLETITLFGNDFGELIKPGGDNLPEPCNNCGFNASLPSRENLLAVCADVLIKILERNGGKNTNPGRLIDDIYWYFNEAAFRACRCNGSNGPLGGTRFDDRIQILSSKNIQRYPTSIPTNTMKNGAAVFGHGWKRGLAFMSRNTRVNGRYFSADEITSSQTPLGVPITSEARDESSESNENQPSGVMSSNTPSTSASSRIYESSLASNNQASDMAIVISTSSKTPMSGINDTSADQQHSASSNVGSTTSEVIAVLSQDAPDALLLPPRNRSIGKIKDTYMRTWKKLKHGKKVR